MFNSLRNHLMRNTSRLFFNFGKFLLVGSNSPRYGSLLKHLTHIWPPTSLCILLLIFRSLLTRHFPTFWFSVHSGFISWARLIIFSAVSPNMWSNMWCKHGISILSTFSDIMLQKVYYFFCGPDMCVGRRRVCWGPFCRQCWRYG